MVVQTDHSSSHSKLPNWPSPPSNPRKKDEFVDSSTSEDESDGVSSIESSDSAIVAKIRRVLTGNEQNENNEDDDQESATLVGSINEIEDEVQDPAKLQNMSKDGGKDEGDVFSVQDILLDDGTLVRTNSTISLISGEVGPPVKYFAENNCSYLSALVLCINSSEVLRNILLQEKAEDTRIPAFSSLIDSIQELRVREDCQTSMLIMSPEVLFPAIDSFHEDRVRYDVDSPSVFLQFLLDQFYVHREESGSEFYYGISLASSALQSVRCRKCLTEIWVKPATLNSATLPLCPEKGCCDVSSLMDRFAAKRDFNFPREGIFCSGCRFRITETVRQNYFPEWESNIKERVLILNISDDDLKVRSDQPDGGVEIPEKFDFTQCMGKPTTEESGDANMFSYKACLTGIIQKGANDDGNYIAYTRGIPIYRSLFQSDLFICNDIYPGDDERIQLNDGMKMSTSNPLILFYTVSKNSSSYVSVNDDDDDCDEKCILRVGDTIRYRPYAGLNEISGTVIRISKSLNPQLLSYITTNCDQGDLSCFVGDSFCLLDSVHPGDLTTKFSTINVNSVHLTLEDGISENVAHLELLERVDNLVTNLSQEWKEFRAKEESTITLSSSDDSTLSIGKIGYIVERKFNIGWFRGKIVDLVNKGGEIMHKVVYTDNDVDEFRMDELVWLKNQAAEERKKVLASVLKIDDKLRDAGRSRRSSMSTNNTDELPFHPHLTKDHKKLADLLRDKNHLLPPELLVKFIGNHRKRYVSKIYFLSKDDVFDHKR